MQSIGLISLSSLMIITSFNSVVQAQVDSARSLGAKTHNIIFDILIPELIPSIKVVAVLSFIRSISDFSTPLIIGRLWNFGIKFIHYIYFQKGIYQKPGIYGVVLCIPVIIMFIFYVKNSKIISKTSHGVRNSEISLNKKNISFYYIFYLIFVFGISVIWYGSIIMSAFTDYEKGKMYFTLEHFLNKNYIDKTVFRSIYYSLLASFSEVWLDFIAILYLYKRKKFLKFFDFFATMPYILRELSLE